MSFTRGLACWTSIKEISFKILWAASIMVTIISLPPSQSLNTIWAPISPPLMEFREIRKTAQSMVMFMSGAGAILLQIFNIMCLSEFGGLQPPFLPKKGCKSFLSKIQCKCKYRCIYSALNSEMLYPCWRMEWLWSFTHGHVAEFMLKCQRFHWKQKGGEPPLLDTRNQAVVPGSAPRCRAEKKGANYLGQELLRGY